MHKWGIAGLHFLNPSPKSLTISPHHSSSACFYHFLFLRGVERASFENSSMSSYVSELRKFLRKSSGFDNTAKTIRISEMIIKWPIKNRATFSLIFHTDLLPNQGFSVKHYHDFFHTRRCQTNIFEQLCQRPV